MSDTIEAVYQDIAVDPTLTRLRRLGDVRFCFGDLTTADVVMLVDSPALSSLNWYREFIEKIRPYTSAMTYVMKFDQRVLTTPEWQAMKALTAREVRLCHPKVWVAVGSRAKEMLGVLGGHEITANGVPVVSWFEDNAIDRVRLLLDTGGEEFLPRD